MRVEAKTAHVSDTNEEITLKFHSADGELTEIVLGVELTRGLTRNLETTLYNRFKLTPRG